MAASQAIRAAIKTDLETIAGLTVYELTDSRAQLTPPCVEILHGAGSAEPNEEDDTLRTSGVDIDVPLRLSVSGDDRLTQIEDQTDAIRNVFEADSPLPAICTVSGITVYNPRVSWEAEEPAENIDSDWLHRRLILQASYKYTRGSV